jgi:DNA repair photolyase
MEIKEKVIQVKDYLTKSNLPASDYVINPYIGCPHACKYCYACFMKRFTGHAERWGTFVDIKQCDKPISSIKLHNKAVFLSSVTDCYNCFEEKYQVTRKILKQLVDIECSIGISTKSKLILRDIDLLKKCKDLKVSISINTLDESFKNDMDNASSINDRLHTLKELHNQGIYTVLFMSPIFPYITDFKSIIEKTHTYIDEYWFENLNLRGEYKQKILEYIAVNYPNLYGAYEKIYIKCEKKYWIDLSIEIENYCNKNCIKYTNYFYHEELVKDKLHNQRSNNEMARLNF